MIVESDALSVRELLAGDVLAGSDLLAGGAGLDATVTGVGVMEVPDVLDRVKPQELLVTSGFPLVAATPGATSLDLVELVGELHARGVVGFGIKLGRYVEQVPAEAVALADRLGFPLIALPGELALEDLVREVHEVVTDRERQVLRRMDELNTELGTLVLAGADLAQIADEVARSLDVGLLITTSDGREQAASLEPALRERLAEAGLLDPSGRVRVERATATPYPLGDGEVRTAKVAAAGADLARLVCVSPERVMADGDIQALERTAMVVALIFTRHQAVAAVENKYRGDFLRDVFMARAGDEEFVIEHAASFGWDLNRPMVVVSAEVDPPQPDEPPAGALVRRSWQDRFAAAWRQVCQSVDRSIATADFSTEVVALVPVPDAPAADDAVRRAVAGIVAAVAGDRGGGRRPFSVGVSRVAAELGDLPEAYSQARRAKLVGRRVSGPKSTTWFDDLGVHRLIALVSDQDELRQFAVDVLGDLAADTEEAADLRATLQNLLDTNLNVAEAARLQFFHYNTMRYRVTKLERLLGPFTSDPSLRLNIALALQVLEMHG
ncbi:PucR family transcriptional regulator [Nocardioides speluncae]|uniref:PucR family transcriptional regulator n=1 Tax=Nocardioides speluncae TaxID=2670337 RepID=UPI00197D6225|nr:PucR family transcriptional regulator [Nocardioides speluncae]